MNRIVSRFLRFLRDHKIKYKYIRPFMRELSLGAREELICRAFEYTEMLKLEGDYLEFGVYKGRSFMNAYFLRKYIKGLTIPRKFYAFDSFQGLPSDEGIFKQGMYSCSLEDFDRKLRSHGVIHDVFVVPGWYKDSLKEPAHLLKKAAVVFIDCDLYESTTEVLNFLTPYIQTGTVIIFDDWFDTLNGGESKAFKEWLEKNPEIKALEWHKTSISNNSFILTK